MVLVTGTGNWETASERVVVHFHSSIVNFIFFFLNITVQCRPMEGIYLRMNRVWQALYVEIHKRQHEYLNDWRMICFRCLTYYFDLCSFSLVQQRIYINYLLCYSFLFYHTTAETFLEKKILPMKFYTFLTRRKIRMCKLQIHLSSRWITTFYIECILPRYFTR